MPIPLNTPRFQRWLDSLSAMSSTAIAENLYSMDTLEGRARRANLEEYFRRMAFSNPDVLIVGEAPGYQGTRRTGIPFGSEHLMGGGTPEIDFFRDPRGFYPVYNEPRVYKEPTSTIMWRTINRCQKLPLLWASYPLHPHEPGKLESNRTPVRAEVQACRPQLVELIELTQVNTVIALGNIAKGVLDELGVPAQKVRHPARGGASIFAGQLYEILPQKA